MHTHKVIYLETSTQKKGMFKFERMDGLKTSVELEALLIEQERKGYELLSITPLTGNIGANANYPIAFTVGLLVTFKRVE